MDYLESSKIDQLHEFEDEILAEQELLYQLRADDFDRALTINAAAMLETPAWPKPKESLGAIFMEFFDDPKTGGQLLGEVIDIISKAAMKDDRDISEKARSVIQNVREQYALAQSEIMMIQARGRR